MTENNNATVDGVRAVELFYRPIKETVSGEAVFYRTEVRLNAPLMGTLLPQRYMAIIENSDRSVAIFKLSFTQLLQSMKRLNSSGMTGYDWFSIYMPTHFLRYADATQQLEKICTKCRIEPNKVCFELSGKIFDEGNTTIITNFHEIRKSGFHFMITGFGGNNFPIIKLADYIPDYLMLSPSASVNILKTEQSKGCIKMLVDIANSVEAELIAEEVSKSDQLSAFREIECTYYMGSLAGGYLSEGDIMPDDNLNGGET